MGAAAAILVLGSQLCPSRRKAASQAPAQAALCLKLAASSSSNWNVCYSAEPGKYFSSVSAINHFVLKWHSCLRSIGVRNLRDNHANGSRILVQEQATVSSATSMSLQL